LAERVREVRARRFESDGVGIGDVVANHIHLILELTKATNARVERS
jgi:hypothetical protein